MASNKDLTVISDCKTHVLRREHVRFTNAYWFECIEKETGLAITLQAENKDMFNDVECEKFIRIALSMGATFKKEYNAGVIK